MANYAGSALYMEWIHSGGTVVLSGDFRTFSSSPSVDLYETSAGADTHKSYLPGIKDGSLQVGLVEQAGGTVLLAALREGIQGTLVVGPEGTAVTKVKETYPAICQGANRTQPYNNVPELSISFQQNGAPTYAGW
jgi:hypothetical protein